MANSTTDDPILRQHVRQATRNDAAAIQRLLRMGVYVHIHVDWRTPGEWLGNPGFVIYSRQEKGRWAKSRAQEDIIACMAVAADPLPAAWVRTAAVESRGEFIQVNAMFGQILEDLNPFIEEIAWFLTDYWPLSWLERLGFEPVNDVVEFHKDGLDSPPFSAPPDLQIRPLLIEDLPALAEIESAAFEPRWRHSAETLYLAWRHSICFEVATVGNEPVAFQFSTRSNGNAHLSRMAVHPDHQGVGIGAALLASAFKSYQSQNVWSVSLNTQSDNLASRKLYERFGFQPTGQTYPVWAYFPERQATS